MKIIAVDDEKYLIDDLLPRLSANPAVDAAAGFTSPEAALQHLQKEPADAAILDIVMPGMNGLELAKRIKESSPETKIIFLTAHAKFAVEAFRVRAGGYLLKPPSDDELNAEIAYLIGQKQAEPAAKNRVEVQTFGNFEIFADGKPLRFARSKSKEILAYLVDRQGATVTKKEIAAVIWEDGDYSRSRQIQLETLIREMMSALKNAGAQNVVVRSRNSIAVNKTAFDCDYYRFCEWDVTAVNSYKGEYMSNYSWAEFTIGYLDNKTSK